VAATSTGPTAPAAVAEAARQLYRAAGREPPAVVLAAADPAAFARLLQAAGRPPRPATPSLLVAGSLVPGALAVLGWAHGVADPAFGALLLVLGVLLLLVAFGPQAGSEPTPSRVRADTAAVLLLVTAAVLAGVVAGSPAAGVAAFAFSASLAGLLRAAALANGGIPGRAGLAAATGASLAALASEPVNESLARELEDALAERRVGPILPAHPQGVADRDGWRRLEEVTRRRLGWARHEQAPILGRLVPAHRRHALLAAESLAEPPALLAAALRLDRRCEAVSLFERAAVVLLRHHGEPARRAPPRWWRPASPPYAPVLGLLQASPVWHVAIALAPSAGLADRLLARLVAGDPDPVLRMDAIERIGFERFFAALGASPVDRGAAGALFVAGQRPLTTAVVRVEDKARDSHGRPHVHWLPVPPHVATAREAVAWTFGKREQDWDPLVET
jgi:hypothetical protein